MTEPLILLFVGIGITVLIGVLVVAVMVRTRRPDGGIREWIRESADSWQENDYRSRNKHNGERVRLDALLAEASPGDSANPLAEVENLRTAAGQMWGEEVGAFRSRRAEKELLRSKKSAGSPTVNDQVNAGKLPPTFAPAQRRRPPKIAAVSIEKDPEDATSYLPKLAPEKVTPAPHSPSPQPEPASENTNSGTGKAQKENNRESAKPIRRWARQFNPDTPEIETGEDARDLAAEDNFQVDKISWERVHTD